MNSTEQWDLTIDRTTDALYFMGSLELNEGKFLTYSDFGITNWQPQPEYIWTKVTEAFEGNDELYQQCRAAVGIGE